eukprot:3279623-Pleurochrysis_carterae.AAC.1
MLVRLVRIRAVVRVLLPVEVEGLRFFPLRLAIAIGQGQQLLHQPRELVAGIAHAHEVIDGKLLEPFAFARGVLEVRGEKEPAKVVEGKKVARYDQRKPLVRALAQLDDKRRDQSAHHAYALPSPIHNCLRTPVHNPQSPRPPPRAVGRRCSLPYPRDRPCSM